MMFCYLMVVKKFWYFQFLPYFLNIKIATLASVHNIDYFDISEDEHNRQAMRTLALNATSAIVPQCGLAPGIVNILAAQLAEQFDELYDLKNDPHEMRNLANELEHEARVQEMMTVMYIMAVCFLV